MVMALQLGFKGRYRGARDDSELHALRNRLFRLVERWRASGLVKNFVCTIKFQGETDHETARAFAALPGATVLHLHNNKHELTFLLPFRPASAPTA